MPIEDVAFGKDTASIMRSAEQKEVQVE